MGSGARTRAEVWLLQARPKDWGKGAELEEGFWGAYLLPINSQFWFRAAGNTCARVGFNFSKVWTVTWLP